MPELKEGQISSHEFEVENQIHKLRAEYENLDAEYRSMKSVDPKLADIALNKAAKILTEMGRFDPEVAATLKNKDYFSGLLAEEADILTKKKLMN
jgi:hypothetical protein